VIRESLETNDDMKRVFLFALIILGAANAGALSRSPELRRVMMTRDWQEWAVSRSDHIGVGTLVSFGDSIDSEGATVAWLVFKPRHWIKGGAAARRNVRVYLPSFRGSDWTQARTSGTACLVFARERAGRLTLNSDLHVPGGGIVLLSGPQQGLDQTMRSIAVGLEPDSLAARSTRVVIGDVRPRVTGPTGCHVVLVDRVVLGPRTPTHLQVFLGPYGEQIETGLAVLMLRQNSDGTHEVEGFQSGILPILNHRVLATDETVSQFTSRMRAASQLHPPRPRVETN
jgi:hypothetical protein